MAKGLTWDKGWNQSSSEDLGSVSQYRLVRVPLLHQRASKQVSYSHLTLGKITSDWMT